MSEDASFAIRIMPPAVLPLPLCSPRVCPSLRRKVHAGLWRCHHHHASLALAPSLAGVDLSNAYAGIGGIRELLMSVLIEPSMLLALFATALVCPTDIATMGQRILSDIQAPVAAHPCWYCFFAAACYYGSKQASV